VVHYEMEVLDEQPTLIPPAQESNDIAM
jgi:hypothetical protein